jgi:hypothetical protein
MLWLKRARNECTEEYVLHPSLKLRRIVSGLPAPDRQISVAPACRVDASTARGYRSSTSRTWKSHSNTYTASTS